MFSQRNGTLYAGVTSDLLKRVYEHKNKAAQASFTAKYNVDKLGYFEIFQDPENAIAREKKIKKLNRKYES